MGTVESALDFNWDTTHDKKKGNIKMAMVIASMLAAIFGLTYFALQQAHLLPWQYGDNSYAPVSEEPVVLPIVAGQGSVAEETLVAVLSQTPAEIEGMKVAAVGPDFAQSLPGLKSCDIVPVAPAVSVVKGWSGGNWIKPQGVTITINAYPAGVGYDALAQLSSHNCNWLETRSGDDTVTGIVFNGNEETNFSTWRNGDVIATVTATNTELPQAFIDDMKTRLHTALVPVCVNPDEKGDTSNRNPYYALDQFTGLLVPEVIPANVEHPHNRTQPQIVPLPELTLPEQPEFPFYPYSLPAAVSKPDVPQVPEYPAVEETIYYRDTDDQGPGCGWEFTGMEPAVYDKEKVDEDRAELTANAQKRLSDNFAAYNTAVGEWQTEWIQFESDANAYRTYKWEVDEVAAQWNEQRTAQETYANDLSAYNDAVTSYNSFVTRQEEAQEKYDEDIMTCDAYANATPEPTTTWVYPEPTTEVITVTPTPEPTTTAPTTPPDDEGDDDTTPTTPEATPTPYETTITVTPTPYPTTTYVTPTAPIACPPARPSILDQPPPYVPVKPTPPADPRPEGDR